MNNFETEIRAIGESLYAAAAGSRPRLYRGVTGGLLAKTMADAQLRDGLFQLVDVLPQLRGSGDIAAHLAAYLGGVPRPGWQGWLFRLAARPALGWSVRVFVRRLARRFLAEESAAGIGRVLDELARVPAQATLDAVGEAVLSEPEADAYLARNLDLLEWQARRGPPHLSLKLTALTSRFDPLDAAGTRDRVFARLEPLLAAAARHGATVTADMEHYELKPLILDLFLDMAAAFPGAWQPAVALQAYLPETGADAERVHAAAGKLGRRLGVRLVKGAYWDQEAAWAAQRGWPLPTFRAKGATDAHYERLTGWLLERSDALHPAIASHNLRSQAVALAHARRLGLKADAWEAQMLYGMGEPLRDALAAAGAPLRIYVPTGDLVAGIAYLIRRLLENTASTSVLRQTYVEGAARKLLLAPPRPDNGAAPEATPAREPEAAPGGGFHNLPLLDFSREQNRAAFAAALTALRASPPRWHALAAPATVHLARNPADPQEVLGKVELATAAHAEAAVATARAAFPAWRDTPAAQRCDILRRAAGMIEAQRMQLAALEVLEQAKPWREADADVAEAADFLRYYAAEMEKLAGWHATVDFPGESNACRYEARGIAVVIAPWNFPLALLAGMTSAALAAGNCALMKPALPALLVAHELLRILRAAGVPAGALQLLPGAAVVGAALVGHRDVDVIAFTGSREVGLRILQTAHTPAPGQRHVKQVVCEMGGKNAIVVDADADLDEAVAGILASAFGYSGQKCSACSRVIAVDAVHDRLLARLAAAAASLAWGPPQDPACDHGPLITAAARDKALAYLAIGRAEGRLVWQGAVPPDGWYAPPAIFAGIEPRHRLAREEVFGPILAVLRAPDFAAALDLALDSEYALTGGVYSRLPAHLALARERFRVGNLYLNRKITGARVGIQPFGGVALSGTGVQAGGPDYLKQFLWSRSVSTNTQRHGFLPAANEL
ncbi:MAG: hypothetical protein A2045_07050 [Rhodocyclales bacterium GWA2_65_20]|nr:MAG: hypothetical protein A2045_07050 [Rhodocyclales bacterium GWA2_65_20]